MNTSTPFSRRSRTTGILAVAVVLLTAGTSLAVFYPLGPSKNEWGLKYAVELTAAAGDTVNVAFTLADEGRLSPVHSYTVVAFSKPNWDGGRSYDVKSKIEFKTTPDGLRTGQVRIPRRFVEQAMIRVLTLRVDGKPQTAGAAYYDIPLNRFAIQPAPAGAQTPSAAAPSLRRVIK